MTPFPHTLMGVFEGDTRHPEQAVAIIATSDTEYMAITSEGETIIEGHAQFKVTDWGLREKIWDVAVGS